MKQINVVIVDDHSIYRKGLIVQLNEIPGIKIMGEASTGKEFIDYFLKQSPDIVFMDINMPEMDGIKATQIATKENPAIKIIAISTYGEEEFLQSMLDAGAKGFLLKNIEIDDITKAITSVMEGRSYFSSELLSILTSKFIHKPDDIDSHIEVRFSKREVEILQLISNGLTNTEIGERLFISPRTVDGHRANLIHKIGAKNTVGLVTYAIKNKIIKI
jgi:DNA-binding NarL/FixJ family response regulator